MDDGYRTYLLITMAIAGVLIFVNLVAAKKRGPSSYVLVAALLAFIFYQYSTYASLGDLARYVAIGLLFGLLFAHAIMRARHRAGSKG